MNNEECSKGQICSSGHFCKDIDGSFSLTLHVLDVPVMIYTSVGNMQPSFEIDHFF